MDARELAKQIAELIGDNIEAAEPYISTEGGDSKNCTVEVAFDKEQKLFHVIIKQEHP